MEQLELQAILEQLCGLSDFVVVFADSCDSKLWAEYLPDHKILLIYNLDEEGNRYPDERLILEGIHELAHHIQHYHVDYVIEHYHDSVFYEVFEILLNKRYNDEGRVSGIIEETRRNT